MSRSAQQTEYDFLMSQEYKYLRRVLNPNFLNGLRELADKYSPPSQRHAPITYSLQESKLDVKDLILNHRKRILESFKIFRAMPKEQQDEFSLDICIFLNEFDLGKEWIGTIFNLILQNWFFPPEDNLYISSTDEKFGRRRVILELNHDTSLADIQRAWKTIRRFQKKLWPDSKRLNYSTKALNNLEIAASDILLRMDNKKINDLDIAGRIWSEVNDVRLEADKRRRSNLRQIRHRMKTKKT